VKIALVSHEYPPFRGGGIGTYATVMSRLCAERGHQVHVITNLYPSARNPDHRKEHSVDGNLHVHRVRGIRDDWSPPPGADAIEVRLHREWSPYLAYAERVAERLANVHDEFNLDIAEFPECAAEGYGSIHRRRLGIAFADLPMTVTLHSPIDEIYRYNHYPRQNLGFQQRKALEDATIREADGISAPSRRLMHMVQDRLDMTDENDRPWDVVRLPIDWDTLPSAPERTRTKRSIMAVGRVEPRKGVIDLIDAAGPLLVQVPDLTLDLIGRDCDAGLAPGTMGDFLRARLPANVRDRLILHGLLPREELIERFASASACVFASRWDNYPMSCLEAMSAGACCLVSDGVGFAEVLTDEADALLFPAGDIESLRDRLKRAVTNPDSTAPIRERARSNAREIADPETMVNTRLAHYERVIASARAPTASASVNVRIAWTPTGDAQTDASVRASAETAGATLDHSAESQPDYRLHVPPGDRLRNNALSALLAVMDARSDAARAAPWTRPVSPTGPMYAGQDFTLPLDLMADLAPRTVLERSAALQDIEPADAAHPKRWRELDLWLTLFENGWSGIVVPLWLADGAGETLPAIQSAIDSDRYALLLEQLVDRHPQIFNRHGTALWLYQSVNGGMESGAGGMSPEPGFRGVVWRAFKVAIKKRFPRLTATARRIIGRRH